VRYNHVHHCVLVNDDGAGIYTLSRQPGTQIVENWLHDNNTSKWGLWPANGLYFDEQSSAMLVQRNVVHDIERPVFCNKCFDLEMIDNDSLYQDVMDNAGPKINPPSGLVPDPQPSETAHRHFRWDFGQSISVAAAAAGRILSVRIVDVRGATIIARRGDASGAVKIPVNRLPNETFVVRANAGGYLESRTYVKVR
jgi:hypothetical protein